MDIELEDRVWRLFYEMGLKQISSRDMIIMLKKREGKENLEKIDILAIDDDIVFIVKCLSQEENSEKNLEKDIAELGENMNGIRNSIKICLKNRDLNLVFIIATQNIKWNENDEKKAKAYLNGNRR